MSAEPLIWLRYAEENLRSAQLLLAHGRLNPCLQNAQQAVEKSLQAVLIVCALPIAKNAQHPGSREPPRCPWSAHWYNRRRRRSAGCHLSAVQVSSWQCPSRFCTRRRGVPPVRTDRREGYYVGETICANSVKQLCPISKALSEVRSERAGMGMSQAESLAGYLQLTPERLRAALCCGSRYQKSFF